MHNNQQVFNVVFIVFNSIHQFNSIQYSKENQACNITQQLILKNTSSAKCTAKIAGIGTKIHRPV